MGRDININGIARFDVLGAVLLKTQVFQNIRP